MMSGSPIKQITNIPGSWRCLLLVLLALPAPSCAAQAIPAVPPTDAAAMPTEMPSITPSPIPSPTPIVPGADIPLSDIAYRLPLTVRHVTTSSAIIARPHCDMVGIGAGSSTVIVPVMPSPQCGEQK